MFPSILAFDLDPILDLLGAFYGPNEAIFGVWVKFKNCSGVYSDKLTSLISI